MKTFEEFLNERKAVDEGLLSDTILRTAKKIIQLYFDKSWVDDDVLDATDEADEIKFEDGKMVMFFNDQMKAEETFKKLAYLYGEKTDGDTFNASGGVWAKISDYNYSDFVNNRLKI